MNKGLLLNSEYNAAMYAIPMMPSQAKPEISECLKMVKANSVIIQRAIMGCSINLENEVSQ